MPRAGERKKKLNPRRSIRELLSGKPPVSHKSEKRKKEKEIVGFSRLHAITKRGFFFPIQLPFLPPMQILLCQLRCQPTTTTTTVFPEKVARKKTFFSPPPLLFPNGFRTTCYYCSAGKRKGAKCTAYSTIFMPNRLSKSAILFCIEPT